MENKVRYLFLLFLGFILCSCLTTRQTNLLREPGGGIPAYPRVQGIAEYRIKPGDELNIQISVFDDDNTSRLYALYNIALNAGGFTAGGMLGNDIRIFAVSPQGNIYFPYLGDIYVKDMTTFEIQELLTSRLTKGISSQCFALVTLVNRSFFVIGEGGTGMYPIEKEQTTIFQALAKSRDIKMYGNRAKVKIIRQTANGTDMYTFDIRSKDIVNSKFYYIQPNDVIYIQPLGRQYLGITSFGAVFAMVSTFISIGLSIYNFVKY